MASPKAVAAEEAATRLKDLPGWALDAGGKGIVKTFSFANYYETMAFVNATAWISHRQDHHPDLAVGYNKCRVTYSTHDTGGLSDRDFECAARVERMMAG
jgi:4a-hydroxytetrahydrobiopterin dehydratase